jgi:hypothetical protein
VRLRRLHQFALAICGDRAFGLSVAGPARYHDDAILTSKACGGLLVFGVGAPVKEMRGDLVQRQVLGLGRRQPGHGDQLGSICGDPG